MSETLFGYPDYARMSLSSGFLLGGSKGDIAGFTTVFQGYVGNWAYINEYTQNLIGTNAYKITYDYFTDDTFSTPIAVQFSIRGQDCISYRQRAVLSPWVVITIDVLGPHTTDTVFLSFYGANERASSGQLASLDVNGAGFNGTIGATSSTLVFDDHIIPGLATVTLTIPSTATQYRLFLQRFDPTTLTYVNYFVVNQINAPGGGVWQVSQPDAPYQAVIHNDASVTGSFVFCLMATSQ